jgi:hypothetical protein
MNAHLPDFDLPVCVIPRIPLPRLTGPQFVEWWMENLRTLERNGQLERMQSDPRRVPCDVPFVMHDE